MDVNTEDRCDVNKFINPLRTQFESNASVYNIDSTACVRVTANRKNCFMNGVLFLFNTFNYKFSIPSVFEFVWRYVEV